MSRTATANRSSQPRSRGSACGEGAESRRGSESATQARLVRRWLPGGVLPVSGRWPAVAKLVDQVLTPLVRHELNKPGTGGLNFRACRNSGGALFVTGLVRHG